MWGCGYWPHTWLDLCGSQPKCVVDSCRGTFGTLHRWGYLRSRDSGTPHPRMDGVPPWQGWGNPRYRTTDGVLDTPWPLAFTQEDFLVDTVIAAAVESPCNFSIKNELHWSPWRCSQGDLLLWQQDLKFINTVVATTGYFSFDVFVAVWRPPPAAMVTIVCVWVAISIGCRTRTLKDRSHLIEFLPPASEGWHFCTKLTWVFSKLTKNKVASSRNRTHNTKHLWIRF